MNPVARIVALCIIAVSAGGQPITEYSGFALESSKLVWSHVYERNGMDSLSLQTAVKRYIETRDNSAELVSEESGHLVYRITDKIFDPKGALISGRLQIDIKSNKYRTTFTSITYKYGARQIAAYESIAGTKLNPGERAFEEFLVAKDGASIRKSSLKSLGQSDEIFTSGFDFLLKKDDW